MTHYYNEIDPYAAQWLKNLMPAHIPPGYVDERDIRDIKPYELTPYKQCHFFAGIAGWAYALVLANFPIDREVWTGSCPCQPFSAAGKGGGFADERHLWPAWFWLIRQCRPATIFGEQVAGTIGHGWLDLVFSDLESEGYTCGAVVLPACGVGAPHIRQRLWFVAHTLRAGWLERRPITGNRSIAGSVGAGGLGNAESNEQCGARISETGSGWSSSLGGSSAWSDLQWLLCSDGKSRPTQPGLFPLAHGVQQRASKLRAFGNAIVPALAAEFIKCSM